MTDMPQLPLGPDGYVDLTVFPDGDPDQVLDPDALSSLHDALAADADDGGGGLDDGVWDELVDSVLSGDADIDIADVLIPSGASDGPFDLSEYPMETPTVEGDDDGDPVGGGGDGDEGDDLGDAVDDQVADALDAAGHLTDHHGATDMVERDDDDGDDDPDHLGDGLGDDRYEPELMGAIDDLSPFDDDHAHPVDAPGELDDLDDF